MDTKKAGTRQVFLWIAALVLIAALASCGSRGSSAAGSAQHKDPRGTPQGSVKLSEIPVQATIVTYGPLNTDHSAAGTIVPVVQSQVAAQVSGVVVKVYHLAGAWVKAGEVVVQLDDSQLRLALETAQAVLSSAKIGVDKAKTQLDLANLTVQRDNSLIKQNLIPQNQVDTDTANAAAANQTYLAAKAAVTQSDAQLRQAELNLAYSSIKAPFAGQLAAVNVTPGEFVGQNTSVFVLVSLEREISFNVPPTDGPNLPVGTPVSFTYQAESYTARVSQAPSAPISGVVPMVALLSSSLLPPYGAVGTVSYKLSLGVGALVPISALQTTGNQEYVYIIEGGKAVTQNLLVISESGTTAVVSGVRPNSQVILNPPPGLLVGSPVRPVSVAQTGTQQ